MKRGIPNVVMNLDNRAKKINPHLLPSAGSAVQRYQSQGGVISEPCSFGRDPLEINDVKVLDTRLLLTLFIHVFVLL